jgi:hypothetical protein
VRGHQETLDSWAVIHVRQRVYTRTLLNYIAILCLSSKHTLCSKQSGCTNCTYINIIDSSFIQREYPKEYWIIYRGPSFLAVVWFGSSPAPPPLPSASCLSFSVFLRVASPVELTDVRCGGVVVWRGAKSNLREKAWPSINHSILSVISLAKQSCSSSQPEWKCILANLSGSLCSFHFEDLVHLEEQDNLLLPRREKAK